MRSLRSLLVEIYPPNLAEAGLESALSDLAARASRRGASTRPSSSTCPVAELDQDTTRLLYRTAQEGLRNVVAHADASRVDVSLSRRRTGVAVLEVADDGVGIEGDAVPAQEGHIGLKGLAGLAATMGASLMIDTTPGRGTTLRLEVPVR